MKIAFDVDATLTDMNGFLKKHGEAFFLKRNKPMLDPDATTAERMYGATTEEMRAFWLRYYIVYCLTVQLKPNLKDTLDRLRSDGHGLHVVTARLGAHRKDFLGRVLRYAVIKKFEHHGIYMDSYTFTNDSIADDKLNVCRENHYDMIVEDNPNHIERIARNLGIPVIVVSTPENAGLNLENIIRIKDLNELENAVKLAVSLCKNGYSGAGSVQ